jgi:hypothetical protein
MRGCLGSTTNGVGDEFRVITVRQSLHRHEREADLGVDPADDRPLALFFLPTGPAATGDQ